MWLTVEELTARVSVRILCLNWCCHLHFHPTIGQIYFSFSFFNNLPGIFRRQCIIVGRETEVRIQVLNWINVSQGSFDFSLFISKNRQITSFSIERLKHSNEIVGDEVGHTYNLSTWGVEAEWMRSSRSGLSGKLEEIEGRPWR